MPAMIAVTRTDHTTQPRGCTLAMARNPDLRDECARHWNGDFGWRSARAGDASGAAGLNMSVRAPGSASASLSLARRLHGDGSQSLSFGKTLLKGAPEP